MASFWPLDQRLSPPTYARTEESTSRLRPARKAWNRMTATRGNRSRNRRCLPIRSGIPVGLWFVLRDNGAGVIGYLLGSLAHLQSCAICRARRGVDSTQPEE